jgi:exonuclease SbcC
MIINKIKLENIRSYVSQEVNFPEGSVLLSGDIGSGKSTVLLAMEFALFGLEKGSGKGLLKNGQDSGSVELYFELEDKEAIIKRVLKRGSKSVSQDAGYIIVNGKKEEGTATELKAKILGLLNYPKEYLTKSKGLIYKYTVYTPQEEMKRILMESKDNRLEVLRRVFDIDKYKRIQENSSMFLKYLRNENKVYEERLKDMDIKKGEKKEKEKEVEENKKIIEGINEELKNINQEVETKRKEVDLFEDKVKELNELRNKMNLLENSSEHKLREKERIETKVEELKKEVIDEGEGNFEDLKKEYDFKIDVVRKNIGEFESNLDETRNKLSGFKAKETHACEIKDNVKDLDKCPTCFQEVKQEYKDQIFKNQDELVIKIKEEVETLLRIEEEYRVSLLKNREKLEKLNKEVGEIELKKVKFEGNLRKKDELIKNETGLRDLKGEVIRLESEKKETVEKLEVIKDVEEDYTKVKLELEEKISKEREIEVRKSGIDEKIRFYLESLEKLNLEINRLEELKLKLDKIKNIEDFLDKHFLNLMGIIEKNVMFKLHNEFNELFKKWFGILNESINVILDEEFTPLITQDGYNIEYSDLSGGERTAVALAYRLSLNQVINNLIGEVKTRDLLILDEPTEGFSNEQLDRVRVVLDELDIKQIIIVSHEAKVESFVDNVLKFEKKNGVSEIV